MLHPEPSPRACAHSVPEAAADISGTPAALHVPVAPGCSQLADWSQSLQDLVRIRRDIHAHPEQAFEEHRTAELVAQLLQSWGLEVHRGLARTGVVGVLRCGTSTRSIALRADMDALPLQEHNAFAHASTCAGKMHACGHDGHTAMLLGAAQRLAQMVRDAGQSVSTHCTTAYSAAHTIAPACVDSTASMHIPHSAPATYTSAAVMDTAGTTTPNHATACATDAPVWAQADTAGDAEPCTCNAHASPPTAPPHAAEHSANAPVPSSATDCATANTPAGTAAHPAIYPTAAALPFDGTVYFIFQPAEESGGGAQVMLNEGLFDRFPADAVYGLHNWPGLPAGDVAVSAGPVMASSNEFSITLHGQGGHAAMPHLAVDPVPVACQLVQAFQTIVSRNTRPLDAAVVSVTVLRAGDTNNIIPNSCTLQGTVRTFSLDVLDMVQRRMADITQHLCAAFGLRADFDFQREYPPTINHAEHAEHVRRAAQQLLGAERLHAQEPTMGAEDFGFMLQRKPGCYFFLGNGDGSHRTSGHGIGPCQLHNPSYDFNDQLIPIGVALWTALVQQRLPHLV